MLEVCEELQTRVAMGNVHSLMVLVEAQGQQQPQMVRLGRFATDSYRALAALTRAEHHVHRSLDRAGDPDMADFARTKQ